MIEEKRKQGRPAHKEVQVVWPNVWTSKGKFLKGDKVTLAPDEIAALGGAVK